MFKHYMITSHSQDSHILQSIIDNLPKHPDLTKDEYKELASMVDIKTFKKITPLSKSKNSFKTNKVFKAIHNKNIIYIMSDYMKLSDVKQFFDEKLKTLKTADIKKKHNITISEVSFGARTFV